MSNWPQIRAIIRDIVAIGIGVYIVWRTANPPPVTIEDLPGFTAAAGFLGVPFVARS